MTCISAYADEIKLEKAWDDDNETNLTMNSLHRFAWG